MASWSDRSVSSMNCSAPPRRMNVQVLASGHPVKKLYLDGLYQQTPQNKSVPQHQVMNKTGQLITSFWNKIKFTSKSIWAILGLNIADLVEVFRWLSKAWEMLAPRNCSLFFFISATKKRVMYQLDWHKTKQYIIHLYSLSYRVRWRKQCSLRVLTHAHTCNWGRSLCTPVLAHVGAMEFFTTHSNSENWKAASTFHRRLALLWSPRKSPAQMVASHWRSSE